MPVYVLADMLVTEDILDLKWSPVMERIELNIAMQISF